MPRTSPLSFRIKEEEKQLLQDAANKLGTNRHAFIRFAVHKYINQLVDEGELPASFVFPAKSN